MRVCACVWACVLKDGERMIPNGVQFPPAPPFLKYFVLFISRKVFLSPPQKKKLDALLWYCYFYVCEMDWIRHFLKSAFCVLYALQCLCVCVCVCVCVWMMCVRASHYSSPPAEPRVIWPGFATQRPALCSCLLKPGSSVYTFTPGTSEGEAAISKTKQWITKFPC